jgi:hypothetical protein
MLENEQLLLVCGYFVMPSQMTTLDDSHMNDFMAAGLAVTAC